MKATAERSADVQILIDTLSNASIGHTVSFDALSAAISRDVQGRNRYLLQSAIRALSKDGIPFVSVRAVGYKRIPAEDVHVIGHTARRRIRRQSRTARATITSTLARANDVSPEARRKASSELSSLGLLEQIADTRFVKKLGQDDAAKPPMSTAAVCREFMQHIGATA